MQMQFRGYSPGSHIPAAEYVRATGNNWRSICGKEKMRSEWQKDECVQDIKLIKTKS